MKRSLRICLSLLLALLCVGCGGRTLSPVGYWEQFDPQAVVDDVEKAESDFVEWTKRLQGAEESLQREAIEEFATMMCSDEVCYYIYTEWAMNYLYGMWSPVRNESAYEYLLQRLNRDSQLAPENKNHIPRLLNILAHNRVGQRVESFVMYDVAGVECSLKEFEGRRVLLLMVDTTCPSCVEMIRDVESVSVAMNLCQSGELALVAVAVGQIPQGIEELAAQYTPSGWHIFCAPHGSLEDAYFDTEASPTMMLIDAAGAVEVPMTRNLQDVAARLK